MCHQTVGLVQGELESRGLPTASITLLPEITRKLAPPRALSVPYPLGFPLGAAHDAKLQRRILAAALALLERHDIPFIADFAPA